MLNITERIFTSGLGDHVIRDMDLSDLLKGTDERRHALVNKAMKAGELVSLRRGLYLANSQYRPTRFSQYYLANHIIPFSFVTAESALSYHGWIPERVTEIVSLSAFGRRKTFSNPYGQFSYFPFNGNPFHFLQGVEHIETGGSQSFWLARPLRALLDYFVLNKVDRLTIDFVEKSLRIEPEMVSSVNLSEINSMQGIYASARVQYFLTQLRGL